jgi:hypothetical protein
MLFKSNQRRHQHQHQHQSTLIFDLVVSIAAIRKVKETKLKERRSAHALYRPTSGLGKEWAWLRMGRDQIARPAPPPQRIRYEDDHEDEGGAVEPSSPHGEVLPKITTVPSWHICGALCYTVATVGDYHQRSTDAG